MNRPSEISIFGVDVKVPCFVRSVSSFECQLALDAALEALYLMPNKEPLLISAFDFYTVNDSVNDKKEPRESTLDLVRALRDRGCFIFIDSGNYEASRTGHYIDWTEDKYNHVLSHSVYTAAFCFDNLYPPNIQETIVSDVIERVHRAKGNSVLPIVHAPLSDDGQRDYDAIPSILVRIAEATHAPLLAIPERELGNGILQRVKMVQLIRKQLDDLGFYQPIHLLGTGNPLSTALLAAAGADSFDGLEWCRTAVDRETGLLYHHQQYDFFRHQTRTMSRFETVRDAEADESINLILKMALHNLDFWHCWMEELRNGLATNQFRSMMAYYLEKHVFDVLETQLPDLMT